MIPGEAPSEIIRGQIISKANNYQSVPGSNGKPRIIKTERIRRYENSFVAQCKIYKDAQINIPFHLDLTVWESNKTYDLDNAIKTVLDCLQYVRAITNDNLCERITATKKIDNLNPRIKFAITPLPQPKTLFDEDLSQFNQ